MTVPPYRSATFGNNRIEAVQKLTWRSAHGRWNFPASLRTRPPWTADFSFRLHTDGGSHTLTVGPTFDETNGSFLLYGTVQIRLPQGALNSWIANGRLGSGFVF
ncbi:MAG: hypothetical protein ABJA82_19145, partial [Myxococcales bacterium]